MNFNIIIYSVFNKLLKHNFLKGVYLDVPNRLICLQSLDNIKINYYFYYKLARVVSVKYYFHFILIFDFQFNYIWCQTPTI